MAKQLEHINDPYTMRRAFTAHYRRWGSWPGGYWQPCSGASHAVRITDDKDESYSRKYAVLVGWGVSVYRVQYLTDGSWRLKMLKRVPKIIKEAFE
jgi:hypothetical protein